MYNLIIYLNYFEEKKKTTKQTLHFNQLSRNSNGYLQYGDKSCPHLLCLWVCSIPHFLSSMEDPRASVSVCLTSFCIVILKQCVCLVIIPFCYGVKMNCVFSQFEAPFVSNVKTYFGKSKAVIVNHVCHF